MSSKKYPAPTIYDIAREAGVSPGTVSRALNNIGYIKQETGERIAKVARELNYTPNRAARALKTKKTGLILLAIPDTDNPFYVDMIKAVQDVVKKKGYSMVLYYTEGKKSEEIKALRMMHEDFADGMILINFSFSAEHRDESERINSPLVLSGICVSEIGGKENDRFDYIGVDTGKGIYMAVKHLISQGHERIGYIGGKSDLEVFRERYEGYMKALREADMSCDEELILWGGYNEENGYKAGKYFLSLETKPTAICMVNDMLALGVLKAFEEEGIKVPEEIALVGMDNINITERLRPKLSSVSIAQSKIGESAAELIFRRLEHIETGPSRKTVYEPELIIRESSSFKR